MSKQEIGSVLKVLEELGGVTPPDLLPLLQGKIEVALPSLIRAGEWGVAALFVVVGYRLSSGLSPSVERVSEDLGRLFEGWRKDEEA